MSSIKLPLFCLAIFICNGAFALPIDWHGVFGVDSSLIDNFRRIDQKVDNSSGNNGTQEVPLASGNQANASFQTYLFRLNPVLIVNDSATFKAEITSGYGRGGRLGDDSVRRKEGTNSTFGNALYIQNYSGTDTSLLLTKAYMELYADTATYLIGRHSAHYGLGAVINGGDDVWDRHSFSRDGITLKLKLGNFNIAPYWAKIDSKGSLTRATKVKEFGVSLLYDNIERDLAFGIHYSKKENSLSNTSFQTDADADGTSQSLGRTDVKLTDLFFKKVFGKFNVAAEIPIISGEIGNTFSTSTKYKAKAIILESAYKFSDSWKIGLDAGKVDGDDGSGSSFEAMYLNPNYQIANLLFRYNLYAVANPGTQSVFDSYITNAMYAKLYAEYRAEKWTWDGAFIYAKAEETAKAGQQAFNHSLNKAFTAVESQSDDLGMEFDLGFTYNWSNEVTIGGAMGYLFAGDYWAYDNDTTLNNSAKNSYILQIRSAVNF